MKITPIKTHKIAPNEDLLAILDKYITDVADKSVVAITSKIVATAEGRVVKIEDADSASTKSFGETQKDELIKQESQYFLPRETNPYHVTLTITNNTLIAGAGIDESNANGNYILWPKNAQKSANKIREHLVKKFNVENIGVIITDSKTTPLRWGVTAISIAFSGFEPLIDYIGKEDLFGRKFAFEKMSVMDNLASAAAFVMGEGAEQTPISIISDIPHIEFSKRNPTQQEIDKLKLSVEEDLYSLLLKNAPWEKGEK